MKILCVDDEVVILDSLKEYLEDVDSNNEVTLKENGLDAFLVCDQEKYDVIIADHRMPLMKGSDLVIALRTKSKMNQSTPILFLSGYTFEAKTSTEHLDRVFFLDKPIDFDQFDMYMKRMTLLD